MRVALGTLLVMIWPTRLAQEQLVEIDSRVAMHNLIGSRHSIHTGIKLRWGQAEVVLLVVVDKSGQIEKVRPVQGPEHFYPEAELIEAHRRYKPFEKNGVPVRATFQDYVSVLPLEKRLPPVPFPDVKDWRSLKMTLARTVCYGDCPQYSVEVHGNGEVVYNGEKFVRVTGEQRSSLLKEDVGQLLAAFRQAEFFSLQDRYTAMITDNSSTVTSIAFDGVTKKVVDYAGLIVGMPEVVSELEQQFDEIAGTEKWVKGHAHTKAARQR